MRVFEVTPHVGIGPLRLGMTPDDVRRSVAGHRVEKIRRGREEVIEDLGLGVDYSDGDTAVTFVQVSQADRVRVTFAGCDVFDTPADELVASVVRQEGLSPADYPPGRHEYLFPPLRLVLWRGVVAEESGEQGWVFECISVHAPGYYDTDA